MSRIAAQKDPPFPETARYQAPSNPVLLAQHLEREATRHPEDLPDALLAIARERLVKLYKLVDYPFLQAIDREDQATGAWVDAVDLPRHARHHVEQGWRTDVGGLRAHHCRIAAQRGANCAPYLGMRAVAPDNVAGKDFVRRAASKVARDGQDTIRVPLETGHLRTIEDAQPRCRRRRSEQHWFEVNLIDPMRRFRGRPPRVGADFSRIALGTTGNPDARELDTRCCRANGYIVWIFSRESGVADSACDVEATKRLHGARTHDVASTIRRLTWRTHLHEHYFDAATSEVHP
jgi:hypothetical protein